MLMDIFVGADVDMCELGDGVWSGANVVLVGRSLSSVASTFEPITPAGQPITLAGLRDQDVFDREDEKEAFLGNRVQDREQYLHMQRVPVGNCALIAETVIVGGGRVADHQICGSTTLIDRDFKPREIVMGSPAGVMGLNHTVHEGMAAWVWAGCTAATITVPTLLVLIISSVVQLLKQYVILDCFPFCSSPTSADTSRGIGARNTSDHFLDSTGFQNEVHELERTWIQTALLSPLVYLSVLLVFFTAHWLVIMLINFSSGQHKLYGTQLVMWGLANELQTVVFDTFGLFVRGTPLMRVYLRALGAKIGKRVFWDSGPPVETRALVVEDDVVVEEDVMVFGHVVDHGLLQFGHIHIGAGSVLNAKSNVQPHTNIGSNVHVGVFTTVMKHDILPDNTAWVGSPAVRRYFS